MIDEQREIIETIRDRRDRAVDAHGRTAAAMDAMHLSPFEQAVYVDAALNTIDRLTAERDVAYAELSRVRYAIDRLTAERDAARAEVERLRAACSRKEDVYPTETVITRSASDLLVEFSQFAFFLGDIRKSKEASYRAQYIRAALGIGSEADHE